MTQSQFKTPTNQIISLEMADTFFKRFCGLMLRASLPEGHGLYLAPCASVPLKTKQVVVDLRELKKDNGESIDLSKIYLIGFNQTNKASVYLTSAFPSMDGQTEEPTTGVENIIFDRATSTHSVYDLSGRALSKPAGKGIVIFNRKKVVR